MAASAGTRAMTSVSRAADVATSATLQAVQSTGAAGVLRPAQGSATRASPGTDAMSPESPAVGVAVSATSEAVQLAVAAAGVVQSAQQDGGSAAASAGSGAMTAVPLAAVAAAAESAPSQALQSTAAAEVAQAPQGSAKAAPSDSGVMPFVSPAAHVAAAESAPSQAVQLAMAAAGVVQSAQAQGGGAVASVSQMADVAVSVPPQSVQSVVAAGAVPALQGGAAASSATGATSTSSMSPAALVGPSMSSQAVQPAAAAGAAQAAEPFLLPPNISSQSGRAMGARFSRSISPAGRALFRAVAQKVAAGQLPHVYFPPPLLSFWTAGAAQPAQKPAVGGASGEGGETDPPTPGQRAVTPTAGDGAAAGGPSGDGNQRRCESAKSPPVHRAAPSARAAARTAGTALASPPATAAAAEATAGGGSAGPSEAGTAEGGDGYDATGGEVSRNEHSSSVSGTVAALAEVTGDPPVTDENSSRKASAGSSAVRGGWTEVTGQLVQCWGYPLTV